MKGSQIGAIVGGIAAVVIISIFLIPSESQNEINPIADKFLIYTTFYPLQQFTANIAGDAAEVRTLIPTNGDPHAFELTPKTIVGLAKADITPIRKSFYLYLFICWLSTTQFKRTSLYFRSNSQIHHNRVNPSPIKPPFGCPRAQGCQV